MENDEMKIEQKNKDVAYIKLDNGLTVYVDTSTGENIIHIVGDKGHPNALGEDASCEFYLIDEVIHTNSFPSDVNIISRQRVAQPDLLKSRAAFMKDLRKAKQVYSI